MQVHIAKVHENLFSGEAESINALTTAGEVTILSHHEPLVATLKSGTITVRTKEDEKKFEVVGGVLEVSDNHVTILL